MASFVTKEILNLFVTTPDGEVVLSGKAGEVPELNLFTKSIEDSDDNLTNDGQLIINVKNLRSHIKGVFAYKDADIPMLQSGINQVIGGGAELPVNVLCTDGSIYSNSGVFVGQLMYSAAGTQELKFVSAQDWILS